MDLRLIYNFAFNQTTVEIGTFTGFLTVKGYDSNMSPKYVYEYVLRDFNEEMSRQGLKYIGTPRINFITVLP